MKKQSSIIRHSIAAVAGAVVLSVGTVAFADIWSDNQMAANDYGSGSVTEVTTTAEGLRTVSVSYADLDLTDAEGQATLGARVSAAAREVCGSTDHRITGSLRIASQNKDCAERAIESARYQTGSSSVAVVSR